MVKRFDKRVVPKYPNIEDDNLSEVQRDSEYYLGRFVMAKKHGAGITVDATNGVTASKYNHGVLEG
jgi:hypothetical protein